ncbi:MHC class I polypeptide-related sequence A isoform X2 [Choloepus didactylus]|nr:MHC class I polypeptide-related sequence A isoform X2 [Choloepus didactylus]XP_037699007.1 MHC class I polypeptide-related sequence A isoform X2 [Choloepus didactylus]
MKVVSQFGFVHSRFLVEGQVDDKIFLHYDSEKGRAELQGPWADLQNEKETTFLKEKEKKLRMSMAEIMALQSREKALHSLQEDLGCEIREDNSTKGFWDFHYDGELFLSYHPETQRWTAPQSSAQSLAMEIKNSWDEDGTQDKKSQPHEEADCLQKLQRYLIYWREFKESTVPPSVNVTCSEASEGELTLTCLAFGFYPPHILVTWLRDVKPLSQDSQQSGGIQPHGNGTYRTWVVTRISQGEEQRYTCFVEHGGENSTHPVTPGEVLVWWNPWAIIISVIIAGAIITLTALAFYCCKDTRCRGPRGHDATSCEPTNTRWCQQTANNHAASSSLPVQLLPPQV